MPELPGVCPRRRRFLGLAAAALGTACGGDTGGVLAPVLRSHRRTDAVVRRGHTAQPEPAATRRAREGLFAHGVASGDPLPDRVILWTRVSVADDATPTVHWLVAEDEALSRVVARGRVRTSASRDHTVKVDVPGLEPGTSYYYAFECDDTRSPVGRTRTTPIGAVERVRLAAVSCANYPAGFFNVYAALAQRDDLDAIVHLGDYIYEYGRGTGGERAELERAHDPAHECVSLADYRRRHAQYKTDPDLQALHARHPFIALWDDHETANNAWRGGAQNHQHGEGAWAQRVADAIQAWREWLPVRDPLPAEDARSARRSLRFGDLVELVLVDARLSGRAAQVAIDDADALADPRRELLARRDERWLLDTLADSQRDGVAWRVLGQQVRMGALRDELGRPHDTDAWDGYPAARDRLLRGLERRGITDLVVLTGDAHQSFAFELHRDPFASPPSGALAVELVTPAVSSPPPSSPRSLAALRASHPHLRWADLVHRGWLELELDRSSAIARWYRVDDVRQPNDRAALGVAMTIPRGRATLLEGEPASTAPLVAMRGPDRASAR